MKKKNIIGITLLVTILFSMLSMTAVASLEVIDTKTFGGKAEVETKVWDLDLYGTLTFGGKAHMGIATNWSTTWEADVDGDINVTNLQVDGFNSTTINLTWTKHNNATHTYIRYKHGSAPTNRSDGTFLTNTTLSYYDHEELTIVNQYYYSVWGYSSNVNAFSSGKVSGNNWTLPEDVKNATTNLNLTQLEFDWDNGTGCDTTVIVQRNDSTYPQNINDGVVIYNATWSNHTKLAYNRTDRFTFYTYNATYDLYSYGFELEYGGIIVYAYKESNTTIEINNFTLFIKNQAGSKTYINTTCNNPTVLDVTQVPNGKKTAIQVSKDGYHTATKYMDIYVNNWYVINFYLSADVAGGGDEGEDDYVPPWDEDSNESYGYQYLLTVVGPQTEYGGNPPIEGAKITIERYINTTEQYEEIYIVYTDANGQRSVWLIPETLYQVTIVKSGYQTEIADLEPRQIVYADDWKYTFRLVPSTTDQDTDRNDSEYMWKNITWSISPLDVIHYDSFLFNYTIRSSDNQLEWYSMYIYYDNETSGLMELIYSSNISDSPGGGSITYTVPNVTGRYEISCWFRKTGYPPHEILQENSIVKFISIISDDLNEFPDTAYFIILIFLTIIAMGFCIIYFQTGTGTGYIGLGVMAFGLLINGVVINGLSAWFIWIVTLILYSMGVFLWSRL